MHLPDPFIIQMQALLGAETATFLSALQTGAPVSVRFNRSKIQQSEPCLFPQSEPVAWCSSGRYLPSRPVFTLDPLLHAGAYYVQEASSMFLTHFVTSLLQEAPINCLDLCAAPGGKSTLLADFLPSGSLLVANEIIRARATILCENLTKWGNPNVAVSHNDPKDFAALPHFFDMIVVDAPCSGEGMFRKDPAAIDEWSANSVLFCAERQRRIVSDAWDALKPNGILMYSTCTYNRDENEENIHWIIDTLGAELLRVPVDAGWSITESDYGYRFYPHKTRGEGFFVSALRKLPTAHNSTWLANSRNSPKFGKPLPSASFAIPKEVKTWVEGEMIFTAMQEKIQALPAVHEQAINTLRRHLRLWMSGVALAELKGKDIIPDIALALSTALHAASFVVAEVDLLTAQRYLRRENISLQGFPTGFVLIAYKNHPIGFVKNIGTRANNLYPKEWRIRMNL